MVVLEVHCVNNMGVSKGGNTRFFGNKVSVKLPFMVDGSSELEITVL